MTIEYYAPAGGQAAANTIVSGVQAGPRAAKLLNGHVVVWEDRSASPDDPGVAIRGQLFDLDGNRRGAEFLVDTLTAGDQTGPSVAALGTGGFVVAWTGADSSGTGIKAQLFTAAGLKSGSEFQVNAGASEDQNGAQAVFVPGLGFAVVWIDYSGTGSAIRGQYFTSGGALYGSQFTISSSAAEVYGDLAVSAVGDGNSRIAVSWTQANGDSSGSAAMARVIKADGVAVGAAFALGQATAGDQRDAALALHAPSKGFVAVYVDEGAGGAVKLRRFSPDGVALGDDLSLTSPGERGDSPSVLAFASGILAVSWIDSGGSQRVRLINPTGEALGNGLTLGTSADPAALIALGSESFLAAWSDGDIQTRAFAPAGPAVSDLAISDMAISEAIPANLSVAQLAASGIGGSAGFTYALVGDSTGGAFRVQGDRLVLADPSKIDFETAPSVQVTVRATDSQGRYRDESFALTVSDSAEAAPGWTVSAPIAPNSAAYGPTVPKVASLASGGFVMVYFDSRFSSPTSGESPVRGRLFSASGEAVGGEIKVPIAQDDNQHPVDVTGLAGGGFAVMFSDYREGTGNTGAQLRVQLFDSSGAAVSDQIKVATTSAGGQSGTLAALPNGGFVVTYANGWAGKVPTVSDVKAQIFDCVGNKVGGEMVVPSNSGWTQADPAVAVLADGGFLIAWTDRSNASIDAQRFDSAGARVGQSFRVSSSALDHYDPSVAALAGGGFVVVWNHGAGFGLPKSNPWDVVGQVFDSAGNKVGGEFVVNDDPVGGERFGVVVPLPDGGFLVTWNEFPSTGDNYFGGITRAQRFDSTGQEVGGEFALDEGFASGQFYTAAAALAWGGVVVAHAESGAATPGATHAVEARLLSPGAFAAANDQLRVTESGGGTGNVLHDNGGGADSAPTGGKLMVSAVNGVSGAVGKTVTLPSGALLKLNADGTFAYDPNHAFDALAAQDSGGSNGVGHDSFTYTLGGGGSATVDVTVLGEYSGPHIVLGTSGADDLAGSGLADTLVGGSGNDLYLVNHGGDVVQEGVNDGTDEVLTGLSTYVLAENVEDLTATSDGAHDFRGNGGDNVITGGSGADFIRLQDGGVDIGIGGDGNDVFFFGGSMTQSDSVIGGAGIDQIAIQGRYWGTSALTLGWNFPPIKTIVSVENLAILPGSDTRFGEPATPAHYDITILDSALAPGVQMVVDANRLESNEDLVFDGSDELDGSFFIYGGGGTDLLTGGAKNDVFLFGAWGQWNPGDVVTGGAGIDQLALRGNYSLTFGAGQLIGIENIGLLSAHDTRFGALGSSYSYDLTMVDENVAAGVQMVVDGAKLRIAEFFRFDGSAELDGSFRVFGGLVDDTIVGSRNSDFIQGNGGADTLTGGLGADIFRYLDSSDSTASATDRILDFAAGTDKIDLSRIDSDAVEAGDQAFAWIGSTEFSGTAGELRARQGGADWFVEGDTDGDGSADFVILVTLDGSTPLGAGDFAL